MTKIFALYNVLVKPLYRKEVMSSAVCLTSLLSSQILYALSDRLKESLLCDIIDNTSIVHMWSKQWLHHIIHFGFYL